MKTFWLNLKKCSTVSLTLLLSTQISFASITLEFQLKSDLDQFSGSDFTSLLSKWNKQYGKNIIKPLLKIASDSRTKPKHKYISIMGVSQFGGEEQAPNLLPFLKDNSWMARLASLKALKILRHPDIHKEILPLISDSTLPVRLEAIAAIEAIQPEGSIDAIIAAIHNPNNYFRGKSLWVPMRALQSLTLLGAPVEVAKELRPLLNYRKDPMLIKETIKTLEKLTGHSYKNEKGRPLSLNKEVKLWKSLLKFSK